MSEEDNVGAGAPAPAPRALCADHPGREAVGTCARCGSFYCGACAGRREGAQGFCRRCDEGRAYVPFEDPELGFWTGYGRTLASSLVALPRFAAELPRRGGWARPFAFAMVPTLAALLLAAVGMALVVAWVGPAVWPADPQKDVGLSLLVAIVVYAASGLGSYLFYLVAWPAVLMVTARIFGNQRLEYEGLFRILCYASGFNFLSFFPVLGLLVFVYHVVLSVACVAAQGRTSTLTALGIVGLPAVGLGGCCCGGYFALMLFGTGLR